MKKLDGLILDEMAQQLFAADRVMVLLKEYLDCSEAAQSGRREKLRLLRAEVTEIDGRLRKLLAMVEAGAMQPDDPILAERVARSGSTARKHRSGSRCLNGSSASLETS